MRYYSIAIVFISVIPWLILERMKLKLWSVIFMLKLFVHLIIPFFSQFAILQRAVIIVELILKHVISPFIMYTFNKIQVSGLVPIIFNTIKHMGMVKNIFNHTIFA